MKRYVVVAALLSLLASSLTAQDDTRHISVDAGLMVFDRRQAADYLADWAANKRGYFTLKSDDAVILRVPDDAIDELREFLETIGDGILHYGRSESDLREDLMRTRASLEAREEILAKNEELLDSSGVEGTLALEQELRRLMAEIDAAKGRLNRLEHDSSMARVTVALSFRQQTVPVQRPSRFSWINGISFYDFLNGYEMPDSKPYLSAPIPAPDGFASMGRRGGTDALSPEGIRLRVRRVSNYPEQNADFWEKALKTDLHERGYISVEKQVPKNWGGKGEFQMTLWALPVGSEDYLYAIGTRVSGKWIEILEMGGKAEYMSSALESL